MGADEFPGMCYMHFVKDTSHLVSGSPGRALPWRKTQLVLLLWTPKSLTTLVTLATQRAYFDEVALAEGRMTVSGLFSS